MRLIPLTQGQSAIVDDCDFERISAHRWYAKWDSGTHSYYAVRASKTRTRYAIWLHREVVGAAHGDRVRRVSGDTLDCRRGCLVVERQHPKDVDRTSGLVADG